MGISEVNGKKSVGKAVSGSPSSNSASKSSKGHKVFTPSQKNNDAFSRSSGKKITLPDRYGHVFIPAASASEQIADCEKQKEELNSSLSEKMGQLASLEGGGVAVIHQQAVVDAAKEAYDNACDESKNPFVKIIKKQQDENDKALQQDENNINNATNRLNNLGTRKSELQGNIGQLEDALGNLASQLASLESVEITDENRSEIEAQKNEIKAQIQAKKETLAKAKEELYSIDKEILDVEKNLKEYQTNKQEHERNKEKFEKMMDVASYGSVYEALQAYNDAQKQLECVKQQEQEKIAELESEISKIQEEMSELDARIESLKEQEAQGKDKNSDENSGNGLSPIDPIQIPNEEEHPSIGDVIIDTLIGRQEDICKTKTQTLEGDYSKLSSVEINYLIGENNKLKQTYENTTDEIEKAEIKEQIDKNSKIIDAANKTAGAYDIKYFD